MTDNNTSFAEISVKSNNGLISGMKPILLSIPNILGNVASNKLIVETSLITPSTFNAGSVTKKLPGLITRVLNPDKCFNPIVSFIMAAIYG